MADLLTPSLPSALADPVIAAASPAVRIPLRALSRNARPPADEAVQREVRQILAAVRTPDTPIERRFDQRFAFPQLMRLVPLDAQDHPLVAPRIVVGKHISLSGLGFFHSESLPYRHVAVQFDRDPETIVSIVLDVTWCRFTRVGWYESGGRFLRLWKPPA